MTTEYQDYGYTAAGSINGRSGVRLANKLISIISEIHDVERICELGCGNGYLSNRLAEAGYQVVGVDASHTGIEIATKNGSAEFIRASFDALNSEKFVQQAEFHVVVSSEVIEHLYRPSELVEFAYSLLCPGGSLIITTPYHGYFKNLAIALAGRMDKHTNPLWTGGHIKFFSVRTLSKLLCDYRFINPRFYYFGRVAGLWKSMICVVIK